MKSSSFVRVRYAETDKMGVVYHSNFFVYFEIARTDYIREFGLTYRKMEETEGVFLPVIECGCHFHAPADYDDDLEIRTELTMLSRIRMRFDYKVYRKNDPKLIAEGFTLHVPMDANRKPCRIPPIFNKTLKGNT